MVRMGRMDLWQSFAWRSESTKPRVVIDWRLIAPDTFGRIHSPGVDRWYFMGVPSKLSIGHLVGLIELKETRLFRIFLVL